MSQSIISIRNASDGFDSVFLLGLNNATQAEDITLTTSLSTVSVKTSSDLLASSVVQVSRVNMTRAIFSFLQSSNFSLDLLTSVVTIDTLSNASGLSLTVSTAMLTVSNPEAHGYILLVQNATLDHSSFRMLDTVLSFSLLAQVTMVKVQFSQLTDVVIELTRVDATLSDGRGILCNLPGSAVSSNILVLIRETNTSGRAPFDYGQGESKSVNMRNLTIIVRDSILKTLSGDLFMYSGSLSQLTVDVARSTLHSRNTEGPYGTGICNLQGITADAVKISFQDCIIVAASSNGGQFATGVMMLTKSTLAYVVVLLQNLSVNVSSEQGQLLLPPVLATSLLTVASNNLTNFTLSIIHCSMQVVSSNNTFAPPYPIIGTSFLAVLNGSVADAVMWISHATAMLPGVTTSFISIQSQNLSSVSLFVDDVNSSEPQHDILVTPVLAKGQPACWLVIAPLYIPAVSGIPPSTGYPTSTGPQNNFENCIIRVTRVRTDISSSPGSTGTAFLMMTDTMMRNVSITLDNIAANVSGTAPTLRPSPFSVSSILLQQMTMDQSSLLQIANSSLNPSSNKRGNAILTIGAGANILGSSAITLGPSCRYVGDSRLTSIVNLQSSSVVSNSTVAVLKLLNGSAVDEAIFVTLPLISETVGAIVTGPLALLAVRGVRAHITPQDNSSGASSPSTLALISFLQDGATVLVEQCNITSPGEDRAFVVTFTKSHVFSGAIFAFDGNRFSYGLGDSAVVSYGLIDPIYDVWSVAVYCNTWNRTWLTTHQLKKLPPDVRVMYGHSLSRKNPLGMGPLPSNTTRGNTTVSGGGAGEWEMTCPLHLTTTPSRSTLTQSRSISCPASTVVASQSTFRVLDLYRQGVNITLATNAPGFLAKSPLASTAPANTSSSSVVRLTWGEVNSVGLGSAVPLNDNTSIATPSSSSSSSYLRDMWIVIGPTGRVDLLTSYSTVVSVDRKAFHCASNNIDVPVSFAAVSPPTPVPVRNAAMVAAVAGAVPATLVASPSMGAAMQRAAAIMQLNLCAFSFSAPMALSDSPTQYGFGPDDGYYLRGGIVGNVLIAAVYVSLVLARTALALERSESGDVEGGNGGGTFLGMAAVHFSFPGCIMTIYMPLLQGTVTSCVATILHGPAVYDAPLAVGGLILFLAPGLLLLRSVFFRFQAKAEELEHDSSGVKAKAETFFDGRYEWAATEEGSLYVMQYGPVFNAYGPERQRFAAIDIGALVLLGAVNGWMPQTDAGCITGLWATALILGAFTILIIVLRPLKAHNDLWNVGISSALSTAAAVLAIYQNNFVADVVAQAQVYVGNLGTILAIIAILIRVDLLELSRNAGRRLVGLLPRRKATDNIVRLADGTVIHRPAPKPRKKIPEAPPPLPQVHVLPERVNDRVSDELVLEKEILQETEMIDLRPSDTAAGPIVEHDPSELIEAELAEMLPWFYTSPTQCEHRETLMAIKRPPLTSLTTLRHLQVVVRLVCSRQVIIKQQQAPDASSIQNASGLVNAADHGL